MEARSLPSRSAGIATIGLEAIIGSLEATIGPAKAVSDRSAAIGVRSGITPSAIAAIASLSLVVGVVVPLDLIDTTLRNEVLEEIGDFAVTLDQNVDEILCKILIAVVVERGGQALVADAGGATDAVDVLSDAAIHLAGKVVVDDMLDILDVPTTRRDAGGDEDRSTTGAEGATGSGQYVGSELCKIAMTYMASSRSRWLRSPWMEVVGRPRLYRKSSSKSTAGFELQKMRVRAGSEAKRRS